MSHKMKRKRGGQAGNQNARKHGFYSTAPITVDQRDALPNAATEAELNHDISITRYKLRAVLKNAPENYQLIGYLLNLKGRLVRTRKLFQKSRKAARRSYSPVTAPKTNHTRENHR